MAQSGFAHVFTVFTPTYNRAHTLGRVHQSLAAQGFSDFEWLIVDDGSTDATAEMVAAWAKDSPFPIRYHHQPNQGKHAAFNQGVALAQGELFLTLDSDDACLPQALERLHAHWLDLEPGERARFSGVTARCQDDRGRPLGPPLPKPILDMSALELRHRLRLAGELWGFTRTDLLRRFPYPRVEGARFLPEDLVWSPIAARYLTRFVDESLRVYHTQGQDRLTVSGVPLDHLPGLMLWHRMILNLEIVWLPHHPAYFLRSAVNYARFARQLGLGAGEQWRGLDNPVARLLWLGGLGLGRLLARRDQARRAQS